jgi:aldose sugar dehydrogenase
MISRPLPPATLRRVSRRVPGGVFGLLGLGLLLVASGCETPESDAAVDETSAAVDETDAVLETGTEYQDLRVVEVVGGLEQPWAVAFLPEDRMLVTERPGRLLLVEDGTPTQVSGLPPIHVQNQGGLLDVVPHPEYDENGWIYITYSKGDAEGTVPALIRARLEGNALVELEEVFESNTYTSPGRHYGSRILFLDDGTLLMTIGDRGAEPPRAQDPLDHSGTVVRLHADGSVPDDNPFVGDPDYAPEVYSYGHRNIQGIVQHPETGEVWVTEHGPRGGDELNLILPGRNYGWPVATLGRDYGSQEQFGEGREHPEKTAPIFEFLPTLAPSGLALVRGDGFHQTWQGNLLAGGLRSQRILRLVIENETVVHAEELLAGDLGRIRDVRQGPDGFLYVVTGEDEGGVYRIEPAE